MARSKVTKFDIKPEFEGQLSAFVAFEDKTWGFCEYAGNPPAKVGDEVDYQTEAKTSKNGKPVTIITIGTAPVQQSSSPTQSTSNQQNEGTTVRVTGWSIEQAKSEAAIRAYGFILETLTEGKVDWPQVKEKQREATEILWGEIDEIYST